MRVQCIAGSWGSHANCCSYLMGGEIVWFILNRMICRKSIWNLWGHRLHIMYIRGTFAGVTLGWRMPAIRTGGGWFLLNLKNWSSLPFLELSTVNEKPNMPYYSKFLKEDRNDDKKFLGHWNLTANQTMCGIWGSLPHYSIFIIHNTGTMWNVPPIGIFSSNYCNSLKEPCTKTETLVIQPTSLNLIIV